MKKQSFSVLFIATSILFSSALIISCRKPLEPVQVPSPPPPQFGFLQGQITDAATTNAIEGAKIYIFNSDTKAPTGETATSDANGNYDITLSPGAYFIRVSKQGYFDVTPVGIPAIPFTIVLSNTVDNNVEMYTNTLSNLGWISGNVTSSSQNNIGALIVATDSTNGYSSVTDSSGNYVIFNVPVGTYDVQAWGAGFNSTQNTATTTTDTETPNIDLSLSDGVSGSVNGSITFLSTQNIEVDVALTHPVTGEAIPGLSTSSVSSSYSMGNVPDGTFLARASFINDTKVMDPDWIVKFGEPFVTIASNTVTRDFSVTGAINVISPTNASTSTSPVEITSTTPTFEWDPYSSTSDYVIEVRDANGTLIWGGFSADWTLKNIVIPSSQQSIVYNFDGNATESLAAGKTYRWRIYASKDVGGGASWDLISVSEEQMGLFTIAP